MEVFQDYAYYYNAFYCDKDYKSEARTVAKLIKRNTNTEIKYVLNIGCGTGKHDIELKKLGYEISGIDLSNSMIEIAKKNNPDVSYEVGDARCYHSEKIYDAVVSLFHVMSYHNTNEDIENACKTAHSCLKTNGIFVFDVWFEAGVLSEKPEVRIKKVEDDNNILMRYASPVMHADTNIVDVNYDVLIINKKTNEVKELSETHHMRYFLKPELKYILEKCGFELLECCDSKTLENVSYESWNAYFVAKKI